MSGTPSRRKAGAQAKANGDSFEGRLNAMHRFYEGRGAYVQKTGPPVRYVMRGDKLTPIVNGYGPPDYLAVFGAWTYAFEAKHCDGGALKLGAILKHQADALTAISAAGTHVLAGVVVELGREGTYWLDWRLAGPRWYLWYKTARARSGEGSWGPDDCDLMGRRCVGLDWMAAAGACAIRAIRP